MINITVVGCGRIANRVEVIGEKGIIFINRCTARTVDLLDIMLYKDGKTESVPVERVE